MMPNIIRLAVGVATFALLSSIPAAGQAPKLSAQQLNIAVPKVPTTAYSPKLSAQPLNTPLPNGNKSVTAATVPTTARRWLVRWTPRLRVRDCSKGSGLILRGRSTRSGSCIVLPSELVRDFRGCQSISESRICADVAVVISLPSSTKCRLRGELRRQARPTTRYGCGSVNCISLISSWRHSSLMLSSGSSVTPRPFTTIWAIVERLEAPNVSRPSTCRRLQNDSA